MRELIGAIILDEENRHLRDLRLDRARAALRAQDGTAVAEIAAACGFAHAGRFSQAYRERFGELSAETTGQRGTR
jgi:transcriptional regulator GlxA family with amidase domain